MPGIELSSRFVLVSRAPIFQIGHAQQIINYMTEDSLFIERDISWLYFNDRVLQEAKDPSVPLYERIKFLAIYSSNLDEFFRVRVASLRSFRKLKKKTRKQLEVRPKRMLKQIRKIVHQQQTEFGRIFREEITPELGKNNIHLIDNRQYNDEQKVFALQYFQVHILPYLKWQMLQEGNIPFWKIKPFI